MNNNIRFELSFKNILQLENKLNFCKFNNIKNIFTYETVSSTEWGIETQAPFRPTRFINISDTISNKLSALKAYDSEMRPYPHARSFENVEYLARTRGASVGIEFAEAFTVIREVLN